MNQEQYMQQLSQALESTMNNDTNIRTQAEQFIKTNQKQAGFATALLNISA